MSAPTVAAAVPEIDPVAADDACYYVLDGAYRGPVTGAELDALHAAGTLPDGAQVRAPGTPGWVSYAEFRARRAATPPAPRGQAVPAPDPVEAAAGSGPRHTCTACRKDWPESLMLMDARRWLCRPCYYGMAMGAKREREKHRRDWWKWLRENWKKTITFGLVVSVIAFLAWHYRRHLPFSFFDDDRAAEPWAKLPPERWPQLVFTNRAEFHRHSALRGQAVFFARRGDRAIVGATAAHLLTADAGVVPDMAPSELETSLRTWWAFPPGAPERAVTLAGLYGPPAALRGYDMLFLTVTPGANVGTLTPLGLGAREARGGEKVFVVAPALPADPKTTAARQAVFPGWTFVKPGRAKAAGGNGAPPKDNLLLDVRVDPPIVPRDLSGAPVVNERGHLVGIVKGWGDPVDATGRVNTVVAQGAAAFREILEPQEKPGQATKPGVKGAAAQMEQTMKKLLEK